MVIPLRVQPNPHGLILTSRALSTTFRTNGCARLKAAKLLTFNPRLANQQGRLDHAAVVPRDRG